MRLSLTLLCILAAVVCFVLALLSVNLGKIDLVTLGLVFFAAGHLPLDSHQTP